MRTISGNSAGSTVGKRSRCASTTEIGRPRIKSSSAFNNGTAASKLASKRTSQAPLRSPERNRFQPCAVGIKNTDVGAVSISKLLPRDHLRRKTDPAEYHLHDARGVARFSNADHAKNRVLKARQSIEFLGLVGW